VAAGPPPGAAGTVPLGQAPAGEADTVEIVPLLGERSGLGPTLQRGATDVPAGTAPPPPEAGSARHGRGPERPGGVVPLLGERAGQPPVVQRAAGPSGVQGTGPAPHGTGGIVQASGAGAGRLPAGLGGGAGRGAGDPTAAGTGPAASAAGPRDGAGVDPPARPSTADPGGTLTGSAQAAPTETASPAHADADPADTAGAASAGAVPGWQRPAEMAPFAPLLGERPVVLASLLALDAPPPPGGGVVQRQAPEPSGAPALTAVPGPGGLRGRRPGSSVAGTPAQRAGPPRDGPPGGNPRPTGVRPPGGLHSPPPTGAVVHATGPVAQRWPAALALGSGLAAPDGAGGLRFAAPADRLTGVAGDRPSGTTEQHGGAMADPAERLGGAATVPVNRLATAVNGQPSRLAAAATGPASQLAAANGQPSRLAAAAPGPAAAASNGAGTADLDDLARRLYDRLRSRLMAELRLDRERAGFVTDLRH